MEIRLVPLTLAVLSIIVTYSYLFTFHKRDRVKRRSETEKNECKFMDLKFDYQIEIQLCSQKVTDKKLRRVFAIISYVSKI